MNQIVNTPLRPNLEEEAVEVAEWCAGLYSGTVGGVGDSGMDDAVAPRVATRPYTPTKAEVEAHEVTHLPYRSWCAHCVAGKGISSPHVHGDVETERIGITISLDYCFSGDEAKEGTPPVLVVWDDGHRAMWALPVETKGAVPWVVAWIVGKLEEAGYSGVKLTLKSDQEPAIVALKKAVALRRKAITALIESPVRESQSNGAIERAIRSWEGQFRTLRHQLEANMGAKLALSHALVEWMVVWAGDLITRYVLRENGRTAFESITGHRCKQPAFLFGETVMFRIAPDKSHRMKANSDWHLGNFIGIESRSSEYLIMNSTGLYKCRSMKRMSRNKAFNSDDILKSDLGIEVYVDKGAKTSV